MKFNKNPTLLCRRVLKLNKKIIQNRPVKRKKVAMIRKKMLSLLRRKRAMMIKKKMLSLLRRKEAVPLMPI
jgi:hypothetical protein